MTTSEPLPDGGSVMWPTPNATGWKGPSTRAPGKKRRPSDDDLPTRIMREMQLPPLATPQDDQELTLFAADSPASPSPPQAAASPKTTRGGFGQRWRKSFADYNPGTSSWRTFQGSLLAEWETYSETWPRAGMTRNGTAYQLPPSAPLTDVTASGSWPTPSATLGTHAGLVTPAKGREGGTLVEALSARMWPTAARAWPTPSARDWRSGKASPETMARNARPLNEVVTARETWPTPVASDAGKDRGSSAGWGLRDAAGGALNPQWVEWLMGYPDGWTDCAG